MLKVYLVSPVRFWKFFYLKRVVLNLGRLYCGSLQHAASKTLVRLCKQLKPLCTSIYFYFLFPHLPFRLPPAIIYDAQIEHQVCKLGGQAGIFFENLAIICFICLEILCECWFIYQTCTVYPKPDFVHKFFTDLLYYSGHMTSHFFAVIQYFPSWWCFKELLNWMFPPWMDFLLYLIKCIE